MQTDELYKGYAELVGRRLCIDPRPIEAWLRDLSDVPARAFSKLVDGATRNGSDTYGEFLYVWQAIQSYL